MRANVTREPQDNKEMEKATDEIWGAIFFDALHAHAMEMAHPPEIPAPPPLGPGAEVLMVQLGLFAAQRNKMDQADDWFARALERNPNRAETLFYAAKLELDVHGNQEAALLHLKKCMRVNVNAQECSNMLKALGPHGMQIIHDVEQAASAQKARQLGAANAPNIRVELNAPAEEKERAVGEDWDEGQAPHKEQVSMKQTDPPATKVLDAQTAEVHASTSDKAACLRAHDASLRTFLRANSVTDDVGATPLQQLGQAYLESYPKLPFIYEWRTLLREVGQENCEQSPALNLW